MPSFLSRVKSFHQQYTASVRGCQEGKQKRATPKCSALKAGVGQLVALDVVDEINHRLQRGLAFAFAQSPTGRRFLTSASATQIPASVCQISASTTPELWKRATSNAPSRCQSGSGR
jgi:hypothetical protein